jgi:hypothetical protein
MQKFRKVIIGLSLCTLAGCATLKAFMNDTVDCAKQDEAAVLAQVPQMLGALGQKDYMGAVEPLLADLGEIGMCAVGTVAASQHPAAPAAQDVLSQKNLSVVNAPALPSN